MKFTHLLIALLLLSCSKDYEPNYSSQQNNEEESDVNVVHVLFIGNSLTIANGGIDAHVQRFFDVGDPEVVFKTKSIAVPGATLNEHLMSGIALGTINSKDWDYIILQENGVVATINPEETIASILSFDEIIKSTTTVYLFMTWAYEGQPEMTDQLTAVYYEASNLTSFSVIPVGLGWRDFENENNSISLLNMDGQHPSKFGTYFASSMIFSILSNQNINPIPYNSNLTSAQAGFIKQKVLESINLYY